MAEPTVRLAPAAPKYTFDNGPMLVELRTGGKGLSHLGGGIIRFDDGGKTEPWRLPYEEIVGVIEGELVLHADGVDPVVVPAGEMATLPKGATVVYEGAPGTRAFYALTPSDWFKQYPHGLPDTGV
ncbi:hypothetical protein [Amycolatopsis anabasis]|uniref:hypothetical protein n=1 Tax=Amycolatopsis anabasis TaxID=1840409 RepID=UPI00131A7993|nr:hypothetical protein [Amycolatopsis anabasis]